MKNAFVEPPGPKKKMAPAPRKKANVARPRPAKKKKK